MNRFHIFNSIQNKKADFILNNKYAKLSELHKKEIQELAIIWCYYSANIEGNTYSYIETDMLLKDGITSPKKYEDAKMIKNLYNTFISEISRIYANGEKVAIDKHNIFRLHRIISDELVDDSESGQLRDRQVLISGTRYIPPSGRQEINIELDKILHIQHDLSNPLEKAVYLHCNVAKTQPFIDGNKRTSRMIESIVLMNEGIIPVYSTAAEDIEAYKQGLLCFYNTGEYDQYTDYFLNRQIQRINDISLTHEVKFDLRTNKEVPPHK